jgi:hypothetical protein
MTLGFNEYALSLRLSAVLEDIATDIQRRALVADAAHHKTLLSPDVPMTDRIGRIQNLAGRCTGSLDDLERLATQVVAAVMVAREEREMRVATYEDARGIGDGLGAA